MVNISDDTKLEGADDSSRVYGSAEQIQDYNRTLEQIQDYNRTLEQRQDYTRTLDENDAGDSVQSTFESLLESDEDLSQVMTDLKNELYRLKSSNMSLYHRLEENKKLMDKLREDILKVEENICCKDEEIDELSKAGENEKIENGTNLSSVELQGEEFESDETNLNM